MPLFNPYATRAPSFLDAPVPLRPTVQIETELPDSFTLQRKGLRVETEAFVVNRGEFITTVTGDYVQRSQKVVTADESYEIVITQVDVGAGSQALQTVQTPATEGQSYEEPLPTISETVAYVDPYVASETGSVAVVTPVPVEAQQADTLYVDPSTFQQFGFDTGTTPTVDPSTYAQFGFDTGATTVVIAPDPIYLHPEDFL